jgi:hypothetical protein
MGKRETKIRRALIIGSIFCCLPGLYILFGLSYDLIKSGPESLNDPTARAAMVFYALYVVLAFAPAIILIKARKNELPRSKILLVGATEVIVVVVLVAGLAAFSGGM